MAHSIAPSLLAADFGNLNEAISKVNKSSASLLHLDVMDGQFVPNISFGVPVIEAVAKVSTKPLDIHLMIVDPDRYLSTYAAFNPEYLTIHLEASTHLHRSIHQIKELGWSFDPLDGLKIMKGEMDYYYDSDKEIQESELKIQYVKTLIDTLKEIVDTLRWRHQTIGNMIKWKQFEAGN